MIVLLVFEFVQSLKKFIHEGFPKFRGLLNQYIAKFTKKILDKVGVKFLLSFFDILNLMEKFEVDLVGQQVMLGGALIVFEEWIILAIAFLLYVPFWFLLHVFLFGVE